MLFAFTLCVFFKLEREIVMMNRLKNTVVISLGFLIPSGFVYSAPVDFESYTCELSIDAPKTLFHGQYYDQNKVFDVQIPISKSQLEQTVLVSDDLIDESFGKKIQFLGNVTVDPRTQKKRLFIGMYEMRSGTIDISKDPFFAIPVSNTDRSLHYADVRDAVPIVSTVSDSGSLEIFNASFQQHTIKFKCTSKNTSSDLEAKFDPNHGREKFLCNIKIMTHYDQQIISESNKQILLGYSKTKRDLQPVMEDSHLDGYYKNILLMGNLFYNSELKKTEFVLGVYKQARHYDPVKHAGFWIPPQSPRLRTSGIPFFYTVPEAEAVSSSGSVEVRYREPEFAFYETTVSCKIQ